MKTKLIICALLLLSAQHAEAQKIRIIAKGGGASLANTLPVITLTSPADSATSVSINPTLTYSVTSTPPFTCSLNFGTSNPPTANVDSDALCGSFQPSTLTNNTQYFWSITATNAGGSVTSSIRSFTTITAGSAVLLQSTDINPTCHQFISPYVNGGNFSLTSGVMTFQPYMSGRRWFHFASDGHLYSFLEPNSLSSCNTALASTVQATGAIDWGMPTFHGNESYVPGTGSSFALGMQWINAQSWLCILWSGTYSTVPADANSISCMTLNEGSHTVTNVGCWAIASTPMPYRATGIIETPTAFNNTYLGGNGDWLVGFGGGFATVGAGITLGPSLRAIDTPATNACSSGTNTSVALVKTLAEFPSNATGPYCTSLGCTPSTAPTTPYPAITNFVDTSSVKYAVDWDPYGGHGWHTTTNGASMTWFDTATKYGVIAAEFFSEGWVNQTVLASPAPTVSYPNVTFSITSTSTHDSHNIQVNDWLNVVTCASGVGDCTDVNANDTSGILVTSVNTGTGAIAGTFATTDSGSGDHKPIVGGAVRFGSMYVQGVTPISRGTLRWQIINPSQYVASINGDIQPYQVIYTEDLDLTLLITNYGCPGCVIPGIRTMYDGGFQLTNAPTVYADNVNSKLIISINSNTFATVWYNTIYIFDVN